MRFAPLFLPTLLLLPVACSSKDTSAPTSDAGQNTAFVARFELPQTGRPDILQVPFPSDLQLDENGMITLATGATGIDRLLPREKGAKYIAEALAKTKGFGVYAGTLFELIGAAPDPSKLPKGAAGDCQGKESNVFYFDLDQGEALECQAAWNDDNYFNDDMGTTPVLTVRTARGVVVPEKHRVAVLLTSGITAKNGAPLEPSASFAALRDGARTTPAQRTYGEAIDAVVAKVGVDKKRIVSAAVYTAGPVSEELRLARELARATALPALKWGKDDVAPVTPARFTATTPLPSGWNASLDDLLGKPNKLPSGEDDPDWSDNPGVAHDAIGSIGVAVFDAPSFLIESEGGYGDPAHGTFFHDGSGKLAIDPKKPTAKVWVSFFVPKAKAPEGGYPVVVFQHGMAGQRGDALQIANSLARRGWATAAIEPVLQGTRVFNANARGDKKNDNKRSTSTYEGPDGFIDKNAEGSNGDPTDLFGGLYRLAALRDQFRQSVIDHTTLLRVLRSSPSLEGLAIDGVAPKLDGSKVAYMGDSLGGILGSLLAGIEPDHRAYILNVPGGALLSELASHSPGIYSLLNGSAALNFGFQHVQMPPHHPMVQLMQHVIDGGDPISVARTVTAPIAIAGSMPVARNAVLIEVLGDEVVSNQATEALARAMGIPLVAPHGPTLAKLVDVDGKSVVGVPTSGSTAALMQLFPAQHGADLFSKNGKREYAKDRPLFGDRSTEPFPKLTATQKFTNPYLEAQAAVLGFIADAFDGKAPTLVWTKAPETLKD